MEKRKIYRRSLVVFSILLAIGIVSYTIFNYINFLTSSSVKREVAKEIQKIKDKREPTTIEELIPEEIADEENGALIYREAFKVRKDLAKKYKEIEKYIPCEGTVTWDKVPETEKKKVKNLILHNFGYIKFYRLFEKASRMRCQFLKRKDYEKGAAMLLSHLAQMRSCARMLAAKAKLQAENKEIEESLNTCLIGLRVSRSLSDEPIIISQLVRIAMDAIILKQVEEILKKGEGSIKIYQALVKEIRNERKNKLIYPGLMSERVVFGMIEIPRLKKRATEKWEEMTDEEKKKIFKPLIELTGKEGISVLEKAFSENPEIFFDENELTYLRTMAKMISLVKKPYWEVREELKKFEKQILKKLPKQKAFLTLIFVPALFRCYNQEARIDAQLGNAEIALACYIYKAKCGKYPESLNELVPGVLPSLPLDPFTGRNYIYRKRDKGFIVYSLGDNLKDDSGKRGKGKNKWEGGDIVWEE